MKKNSIELFTGSFAEYQKKMIKRAKKDAAPVEAGRARASRMNNIKQRKHVENLKNEVKNEINTFEVNF